MLTLKNIAHYLLERGFVTRESLVEGDFLAVDCSRRNRNFKIIRRNHPCYFVKQVQSSDPQAIASLEREANCYWVARNQPEFGPVAGLMPKYYGYDPAAKVLVLELEPGGENLAEFHRRSGQFPVNVAMQLGRLLGSYHRQLGDRLENGPHPAAFPRLVPWVLSIHQQRPEYFNPLSGGNRQLLELVRSYPEFAQALDALRAEWRVHSLIHGDIKWDNCIVRGNGRPEETEVKLIDWEMADLGDACWDLGALLQSYLVFWILSLPIAPGSEPSRVVDLAQYPLERMQPAIRALWNGYAASLQLDSKDAGAVLAKAVRYAGARMIQSAFETLYYSDQLAPAAISLLQVSLNILAHPQEARADLFAL